MGENNQIDKYNSFNLLDGLVIRIPYNTIDIVILNAQVVRKSVEFSHMHHCYELYMVIEGSFKLQIEGKEYDMYESDICWIGPGVEHLDIYKDNPNHIQMIITFDIIPSSAYLKKNDIVADTEISELLKQTNANRFWIGKDIRNCKAIFESICDELSRCEIGSYMITSNLLSNFIVKTLQCMQSAPSDYEHPLKRARVTNKAREITIYLDQHYAENITLQDAAENLHITTRHINRVLNDHFNMTFTKMLTITRLTYAKLYILNTDYSIEKIAELVGFSSARVLYKLFKEVEGITISTYRKQNSVFPIM